MPLLAKLALSMALAATVTPHGHRGADAAPITRPATGPIRVAFVLSEGAELLDTVGPWEVFQYTRAAGQGLDGPAPFQLYTVAETREPIVMSGGIRVIPEHTFDDAPAPHVIVIPAQRGTAPRLLDWIRANAARADVTMSVCVGSFTLARTGLLDGKPATTHHEFYEGFQAKFPKVEVRRGVRYVEAGKVATAAGLSSGIDLALRVVERYFGRATAETTAAMLEYEGTGWLHPERPGATAAAKPSGEAPDVVCGMSVKRDGALTAQHEGKTWFFCSESCRKAFTADPAKYLK